MFTNHLIHEKSPYLLQHAHNPVDWYPWCREAFERAAAEEKPIFLSIGYSTCHWCHVMEQESFEDRLVADILNRDYISVKVDREERPDVDSVYMNVCQIMNGSGGWPLTILMTAEQKPFYAGTYLPKENRYGQTGLVQLLSQVSEKWNRERPRILALADDLVDYIRQKEEPGQEQNPGQQELKRQEQEGWRRNGQEKRKPPKMARRLLKRGAEQLERMFDEENGGFGTAPKFPIPHNLLFLLKLYEASAEGTFLTEIQENPNRKEAAGRNKRWQRMTEVTLQQMYRGGIFDHIGGGFSRYSTDEAWMIPHFEKMLYDNALLSLVYLEAWRLFEAPLYLQVAERTLAYMMRELTHEKGGFFCGQDADSEGEEGKYYVFIPGEVSRVLGEQEGKSFCQWYGIKPSGNFEGKSILNLLHNESFLGVPKLEEQLEKMRQRMYEYRRERTVLHRDDKILTSWNGLAIWAFARAFQITGITAYYKQAKAAAVFVRANLMTLNGRLKVRWREGEAAHEGNLEDYAFFGLALFELYQCDFEVGWLRSCIQLTKKLLELFWDSSHGGFFFYGAHSEHLITRPKETYDGAMPSGNSAAGLLLVRLAKLTGERKWREAARQQLAFLMREMDGQEAGHTMALMAIQEQEEESIHLVCAAGEEIPDEEIRCYRKRQTGNVHALVVTAENRDALARFIPQAADYPLHPGKTTYYVCRGESCQPPVTELKT